jgi:hypothetical protein
MPANIINATATGINITSGDESQLNLQLAGITSMGINPSVVISSPGVLRENAQTVNANYTITAGRNAYSVGPISLSPTAVITIPNGSVWTVI